MAKGRATTVWAAIHIPHACTMVALAEGLEHCLFSWLKQVLPSLALRREKSLLHTRTCSVLSTTRSMEGQWLGEGITHKGKQEK